MSDPVVQPPPSWDKLRSLPLVDWHPVSQLKVPQTSVLRTSVPAVDVHNHLGRWLSHGEWMIDNVPELLATMDGTGIETIVNLDGMWDEEVSANVTRYDAAYPGRFLTFCQLDWAQVGAECGAARLRASLDDSAARGARGVKVWKNLGLTVRDTTGDLVMPDDPRVVDVMRHAGVLGLPVLIHTADPIAFFEPLDSHNERLDELLVSQDLWFGDRAVHPSFDRLLDAHAALVLACPDTMFIGAHAGGAAEHLDRVSALLDIAPNYTIDTAGRMAELGRQPRRFAAFVAQHPDRVLFGTDVYPASAEQFRLHARFLETLDEAFMYTPDEPVPPQGRWTVSGLGLAPDLLGAVYRDNAARVLGL
ncbi:MAG: amidohydrolase family protein [Pseudolysinimonas sp.]